MDRFNVAVKVVQNAGDLLRQCRLEEAEVSQKTGHQDLVTRWDRRIEQLLRNEILTAFPQDAIVGEEYPPDTHRAESITWYIDPIDGTTDAILGKAWRRRMAGSDTDPHIRPTGTIGAVADNTRVAIYLPGATSLSGADDPALPEGTGSPVPRLRGLGTL